MRTAIKVENLGFGYKKQPKLISNLDLEIKEGLRFGIFGPNGAGKTTLMSLMAGLLDYSEGSIKVLGTEVSGNTHHINRSIAFVPQDFSFYEELSPAENMEFFGAWYGLNSKQIAQKTDALLQILGLSHAKNKPLKTFSGGMKRRVNLAIGVMNDPGILFLDEPTVGVDVQSRHAIIDFLKQLNQTKNTTLVYTSHHLKEAEDLCQEVALIDQGQIITEGPLQQLYEHHKQDGLEGLFLELTGREYRD